MGTCPLPLVLAVTLLCLVCGLRAQPLHAQDQAVLNLLNSQWSLDLDCDSSRVLCNFDDPKRVIKIDVSRMSLDAGLPSQVANLEFLEELSARENNFRGTLPSELALLRNLRILDVGENPRMEGIIPTHFGNFQALEKLMLERCDFRGNIPSHLGLVRTLVTLHVGGNPKMTGSLPSELGLLSNLQTLSVEGNHFSGESENDDTPLGNFIAGPIPTQFGRLTALRNLYLERNRLSGAIPTEFRNLLQLREFFVHHNRITGRLPTVLCQLNNLRKLYVTDNRMNGPLPPCLRSSPSILDFKGLLNDWECPLPDWCAPNRCAQRCTCVGGACVGPLQGGGPDSRGCWSCFNCTAPIHYGPHCALECQCDKFPDIIPANSTCLNGPMGNGSCLTPNGTLFAPPTPPTFAPTPPELPDEVKDLEAEEDDRRRRQAIAMIAVVILFIIIIIVVIILIIIYQKREENKIAERLAAQGLRRPRVYEDTFGEAARQRRREATRS